jgi:hypothetical protein
VLWADKYYIIGLNSKVNRCHAHDNNLVVINEHPLHYYSYSWEYKDTQTQDEMLKLTFCIGLYPVLLYKVGGRNTLSCKF